jgi:hypothetical protein
MELFYHAEKRLLVIHSGRTNWCRIVFEVDVDRFAIDHAITELNQKPAQVIRFGEGPWLRPPRLANSEDHGFVKIQDDQLFAEDIEPTGQLRVVNW